MGRHRCLSGGPEEWRVGREVGWWLLVVGVCAYCNYGVTIENHVHCIDACGPRGMAYGMVGIGSAQLGDVHSWYVEYVEYVCRLTKGM